MAGCIGTCRLEDITEALWGTRVSPGTVSRLNKKVYEQIEEWRNRPLTCDYPYVVSASGAESTDNVGLIAYNVV